MSKKETLVKIMFNSKFRNSWVSNKRESINVNRNIHAHFKKIKNKNSFILMCTPRHVNLGDQAIALAEIDFLKKHFTNFEILEIPHQYTKSSINTLKKYIKDGDIIFLHGGGNMGNLYPGEEEIRQIILRKFSENKILSFPQTIYFDKKRENYSKDIEQMKEVYGECSRLIIGSREKKSFNIMNSFFPNNKVYITPDIVLSLEIEKYINFSGVDRSGVITLFRDDQEKAISENFKQNIECILKNKFDNKITKSDTHLRDISIRISADERENFLKIKWRDILKHQLLVTDRLHGMIFGYLTRTPTIVLNISNHKIEETYDNWLKNCNYIIFVNEDDLPYLDNKINELLKIEPKKLNFDNEFDKIVKWI